MQTGKTNSSNAKPLMSTLVDVKGKKYLIELIKSGTKHAVYFVNTHKLRIGKNPDALLYNESKCFKDYGLFNLLTAKRYFEQKISEIKSLPT